MSRLLLVLPIKAYVARDRVYIDRQACNGLRLWLENFVHVTFACHSSETAQIPADYAPIHEVPGSDRLTFVALPTAYLPHIFLAALPKASRLLLAHIKEADYLSFAIGGLWGDWASVACLLATDRAYSVWTDRVESQVATFAAGTKSGAAKIYALANAHLMKILERHVIRRSSLGLFHGADCYNSYARFCSNPYIVHDIHVGAENLIAASTLETRLQRSGPLRIAYAGRAHREKGIFDWIEALAGARSRGLAFEAIWYGDGPDLPTAREKGQGLAAFPGSQTHAATLEALKEQDVFVFCHKTAESPRCLIEALQSGLPIIGYDSPYPRDLTSNGGGIMTTAHQPEGIAEVLLGLDRERLQTHSREAREAGSAYTDVGVFKHRSQLIKANLPI